MGVTPRRETVWLSPDPPLTRPSRESSPPLPGRGGSCSQFDSSMASTGEPMLKVVTTQLIGPEVRRTERATHIVILTVVVSLLLPLLLWPGVASLIWWLRSDTKLDIVVYDQTVPDASFLEHASLGLALGYEKVPFDTGDSFIGAAPGGAPQGTWPAEAPHLVMLVDAYGVYLDDTGEVSDEGTSRITDALEVRDADLMTRWAATGTVVYGEFNILGEPTSSPASQQLQGLFGVETTGWAGRSFNDLAVVSDRLVDLAGGTWDHTGPGIVLLAPRVDGAMVVVLSSNELEQSFPMIDGVLPGSGRSTSAASRRLVRDHRGRSRSRGEHVDAAPRE